MRLVNSLTIILIAVLTLVYLTEPSVQCHDNNYRRNWLPSFIYALAYLSIGICFLICGLKMINITRMHYQKFYDEFGTFMWYATFLLSIPVILRALNSFLLFFNWWQNLYFDHWVEMSTFYILLFNILPLITQLSSLYFGARQYKKKRDQKLLKIKARTDSQDTKIGDRNSSSSESDEDDYSRYSVLSQNSSESRDKNIFNPPIEKYKFKLRPYDNVKREILSPSAEN